MNILQTLTALQKSTVAARERTGDALIGTEVKAGSASLLDGCKSIMDSIAVSSSVIEHNKQAEPVHAGELPDEREAFEAEMRCVEEWGHRSLKKRTNGKYENWQVALMWDVWQARSALSARKPLTSEQVKALKGEYGYSLAPVQAQADFINGIRCGEKAHGIDAAMRKDNT